MRAGSTPRGYPSRSSLGWRAAPQTPCKCGCTRIVAPTHDSVVLRPRSVPAAQLCPESCASDLPLCMHHFGVPRGNAHGGGVGGSAPDRAQRRRPTSSKLRAPPMQIARCSCLNRIIQESYGDGTETSRPATPSITISAASTACQRQIPRYIRRPKAASPIAISATSSLTTSIAP